MRKPCSSAPAIEDALSHAHADVQLVREFDRLRNRPGVRRLIEEVQHFVRVLGADLLRRQVRVPHAHYPILRTKSVTNCRSALPTSARLTVSKRATDVARFLLHGHDRPVVAQQVGAKHLLVRLDLVAQVLGRLAERVLELGGELAADPRGFAGGLGGRTGDRPGPVARSCRRAASRRLAVGDRSLHRDAARDGLDGIVEEVGRILDPDRLDGIRGCRKLTLAAEDAAAADAPLDLVHDAVDRYAHIGVRSGPEARRGNSPASPVRIGEEVVDDPVVDPVAERHLNRSAGHRPSGDTGSPSGFTNANTVTR